MPVDYAALRAEIEADPNGYGYAPLLAAGDDQGLADLLNLVRPAIQVRRQDIAGREIYEAIAVADYTALPASPTALQLSAERRNLAWITGLASIASIRLLNDDGTDGPAIANLKAMFPAGSATRNRLAAIAQRDGSRAEQLFGAGTAVGHTDVARAFGRG